MEEFLIIKDISDTQRLMFQREEQGSKEQNHSPATGTLALRYWRASVLPWGRGPWGRLYTFLFYVGSSIRGIHRALPCNG